MCKNNKFMSCNLITYLNKVVGISPKVTSSLAHYVDISLLEYYIQKEEEQIKEFLKQREIWYKFDKRHYNLKLIFERENETNFEKGWIKKFVAHILISHDLFINLFYYLKRFLNYGTSEYKLNGILNYLKLIKEEYSRFTNSFNYLKTHNNKQFSPDLPAWFINIPSPEDIYCIIDEIFYFNENGIFAIPLLRTYFEVKFYSTLKNIINDLYKKVNNNSNQRLIDFTRKFGI